jgi:hypothetical protein
MDIALLAIKVVLLTTACSFGPGLLLVGKLRWSPLERLCGAVAASFIVTYLVCFALFILRLGDWAYLCASGVFALMGILGWRTARLLIRRRSSRGALIAWGCLLLWYGLHLAMVRIYSGGDWMGDWQEHYQRAEFWAGRLPWDFQFIDVYWLPARPPLMNMLCAFVSRQAGLGFESFSLVSMILNSWAFLPCCLLVRYFSRRGRRLIPILALLFMLNPSIVQNSTITFTKAHTVGYVLLGLAFYLRGRIVPSAVVLAAGILSHYSAAPFALAIGLHGLYCAMRGRLAWQSISLGAAAAGMLLATWLVWSIVVYGSHITFLSNSTVKSTESQAPETNVLKVLNNMYVSLVPHPLRPAGYKPFVPIRNWGNLRDYYFMICQTCLPTMMGLSGGIIAVWALARAFMGRETKRRGFWIYFLIFTFVVGMAVNGNWNGYGLAHVTLQPLALLGVTLVAAALPGLGKFWRWVVPATLLVDYALGILLEFDRQSYLLPTIYDAAGKATVLPDVTIGGNAALEYLAKLQAGYVFWGDHFAGAIPVLEIVSGVIGCGAVWMVWRRMSGKLA